MNGVSIRRIFNPKNLMVLKRNACLFYGRLKFHLLLLIVPILLMVIAGGRSVFYGISITALPKSVPYYWLIQLIMPLLIMGESSRRLFRHDIILSPRVSLNHYLLDNLLIVGSFSLLIWISYGLASFIFLNHALFWSYFGLHLLFINSIYSLLAVLFKPTMVILVGLILSVFNVFSGDISFLNLTMIARFSVPDVWVGLFELCLILGGLLVLVRWAFNRIDYTL